MQAQATPLSQAQINLSGLVTSYGRWQKLWKDTLDFVFPPRCAHCGRVDSRWCDRCMAELAALSILPHQIEREHLTIYATSPHRGLLREAIHTLKYGDMPDLAAPLAQRLSAVRHQSALEADVVSFVPMHAARQAQRGYNQAALLAWHVAQDNPLRFEPNLLHRIKETRSQVGLDYEARQQNVADAFRAENAEGLRVILVDDVFTTGATLLGCANALYDAGATQVYGLTVTAALSITDDQVNDLFQ